MGGWLDHTRHSEKPSFSEKTLFLRKCTNQNRATNTLSCALLFWLVRLQVRPQFTDPAKALQAAMGGDGSKQTQVRMGKYR
jgi:hypothetical protein